MGARAATAPRRTRQSLRLSPCGFLAADGHLARQDPSRAALGNWNRPLENLGMTGGLGVFASPSVGYLIGFPFAAFVAGLVVERWSAPITTAAFVGSLLGGIVVLYAFGIPGMAVVLDKTLPEAALLATPFLAGDLIKCALAALITRTVAQMRPTALLSRA